MNRTSYRLTEDQPDSEPLTLSEMKLHLRVEHDADDAFIASLIASARESCETFTGRALISRACSLWLDAWPYADAVDLPRLPVLSIGRINAYDEAGVAIEFSTGSYYVDIPAGRVVLKGGASPPLPLRGSGGVEIQFKAGYGVSAEDVPLSLHQGMKQIVAQLYQNRGDGVTRVLERSGALALFQPYRMMRL